MFYRNKRFKLVYYPSFIKFVLHDSSKTLAEMPSVVT